MTIFELLKTEEFNCNRSHLARHLNINRGTLNKYAQDRKGRYHLIRWFNDRYQLLVLTSKQKG